MHNLSAAAAAAFKSARGKRGGRTRICLRIKLIVCESCGIPSSRLTSGQRRELQRDLQVHSAEWRTKSGQVAQSTKKYTHCIESSVGRLWGARRQIASGIQTLILSFESG